MLMNLFCVHSLTYLSGKKDKSHSYHEQHKKLSKPIVRIKVSISNCCDCDNDKIKRLEQILLLLQISCSSLDMLNATDSIKRSYERKN